MRGRQIPLGGRVAARPARTRAVGPDPLAAHGWREVRGVVHPPRRPRRTRAARVEPRPLVAQQQKQRAALGRRVRLALAALVVVALAGLAGWVVTTPDLRIRQVSVQGTADAGLIAQVRALPLTGCFVLLCDTDRDVARVEALPQVASARIWLASPTTLVVRVTPRVPVLVWRAGGHALLVGGDGVVIGPASAQDAVQLPVIDDPGSAALPGGKTAPRTKLPAQLVELAAQLRKSLPAVLGSNVSLSYNASLGLIANDGNGTQVVFGDPSRVPAGVLPRGTTQLAELRAILATLAQAGQHASLIDLRWGSHPAYTLG